MTRDSASPLHQVVPWGRSRAIASSTGIGKYRIRLNPDSYRNYQVGPSRIRVRQRWQPTENVDHQRCQMIVAEELHDKAYGFKPLDGASKMVYW